MFCTTECWDCEDKSCKHYISKQELYFKNQQLRQIIDKVIQIFEECKMLFPHEFDWEEQFDNALKILKETNMK